MDFPLSFQKNFQFTPGINTLLKFWYEILRCFCEVCGMLTHNTWECLNNQADPAQDNDDDDHNDDNHLDDAAFEENIHQVY